MQWRMHGQTVSGEEKIIVVGVMNVTPDSYYDGGKYVSEETIAQRAREIIEQGGDMIDIGGESTGPGSKDVAMEEELQRVLPAIAAVKKEVPDAWISVDTYRTEVARQAVEAGAHMINDVTAGRGDTAMFETIAKLGCPYVMMYAKDKTPRTTVAVAAYEDVVKTIHDFLEERCRLAKEAGITEKNIIVDPGLGHFVSSDPHYSFELLRNLESVSAHPIFVSPSRKSFVAGPENLPPEDRLPGTLAATAIAVSHGARFIRTHDVRETRVVCDLLTSAF